MTRDEAAHTIDKAINTARAAYWAVCSAEERAIDPTTLGAAENFLDEAQASALLVEYVAQDRGLSWAEAHALISKTAHLPGRTCNGLVVVQAHWTT